MFGIGWTEAIFIAIVVLLFVGPKQLPVVFRKLGRLARTLQSASRELQNQLEIEAGDEESPAGIIRDLRREAADLARAPGDGIRGLERELGRGADLGALVDDRGSSEGAEGAEPDEAGNGDED